MSVLEKNWQLLSDLVRKAIARASKKNDGRDSEAFFTSSQTTEVNIRNSEILTQNKLFDSGVGFRVVIAGKVGFACTNTLSEKAIFGALEKASTIAKVSHKIPNFSFPTKSQLPNVEGLFDSRVAEIAVEDAVDIAKRGIVAAEDFDKRVTVKSGRVIYQSGWRGIINSLGVDFEDQETTSVIYLGGSGQQGNEVTGGCYDSMFSREADLDPEKVGETIGKNIVRMFNKKPLKEFQGTVIFGSGAVSYQIVNVLNAALNGENVLKGRSAWAKNLTEIVASEQLTIIDNALLAHGFASRRFDDEGCPSQQTMLINKGKLENYLHFTPSANALNTKTTANASRSPSSFDLVRSIVGTGYRAKPEIYPSNLMIQPGNRTKEELLVETDKGVLIESMAGFPQSGSGQLSAQLSRAHYIENGEIQFPIKDGMVSGVVFDWLKQISGVSKDLKQYQNSVLPSLRVEGVKVVSG